MSHRVPDTRHGRGHPIPRSPTVSLFHLVLLALAALAVATA
ncbi:hypothetical protein [Streptomyces sp. NBC_01207]|nr:hypothetical protein OG457_27370 [Streptomyces sp. NBC_01207]